jgi:dihydroorotate dehydrogenase
MKESPNIGFVSESIRHLVGETGGGIEEAFDIWRHEGLKKGVENGLNLVVQRDLGRWVLERISGSIDDDRLRTNVGGVDLDSPIGIAPGWDKRGKTIAAWEALGASHISIGGISLISQIGNRMPRLHTMDSQIGDHGTLVSLNSFGFSNLGSTGVVREVAEQKERGISIPVILQATANKEFYEEENRHLLPGVMAATVRKLIPVADAIGIGLSSPNTLGMREAQQYELLYEIVSAIRDAIAVSDRDIPIVFKGDADGGEERLDMYCRLTQALGIEIIELINTTALPNIKSRYGLENRPGGLAGADAEYRKMALDSVSYVYNAIGDKTDIIGVGGIGVGEVWTPPLQMIRAGASAVSVNSYVRSSFPGTTRVIKKNMLDELSNSAPGFNTVAQVIGIDTKRGRKIAA